MNSLNIQWRIGLSFNVYDLNVFDRIIYINSQWSKKTDCRCSRSIWDILSSTICIKALEPKYLVHLVLGTLSLEVKMAIVWIQSLISSVLKKVKWSSYRPCVAQRVGRGIALLFHDCSTRRGWVVSSTPWPHFTLRKELVPILQEAGWAPGPVWTGGKSHPPWDSIPDHPACSQFLYQLSYPTHISCVLNKSIVELISQLSDMVSMNGGHFSFNL